jgi:hypothetical protein
MELFKIPWIFLDLAYKIKYDKFTHEPLVRSGCKENCITAHRPSLCKSVWVA